MKKPKENKEKVKKPKVKPFDFVEDVETCCKGYVLRLKGRGDNQIAIVSGNRLFAVKAEGLNVLIKGSPPSTVPPCRADGWKG